MDVTNALAASAFGRLSPTTGGSRMLGTAVRDKEQGAPASASRELATTRAMEVDIRRTASRAQGRDQVRLIWPDAYGTFRGMKKTLHIDQSLLLDAKQACGADTDTETVRRGLEALVRHAAYERLRALGGAEPHARDVSRRREKTTRRKAA